MKNILIIDGAENCVYDIFSITDEQFSLIFPNETDIAFIDEVEKRLDKATLVRVFENFWVQRCKKSEVMGIHGTLFYKLEHKKAYYPTYLDEEAINPNGSKLR